MHLKLREHLLYNLKLSINQFILLQVGEPCSFTPNGPDHQPTNRFKSEL